MTSESILSITRSTTESRSILYKIHSRSVHAKNIASIIRGCLERKVKRQVIPVVLDPFSGKPVQTSPNFSPLNLVDLVFDKEKIPLAYLITRRHQPKVQNIRQNPCKICFNFEATHGCLHTPSFAGPYDTSTVHLGLCEECVRKIQRETPAGKPVKCPFTLTQVSCFVKYFVQ